MATLGIIDQTRGKNRQARGKFQQREIWGLLNPLGIKVGTGIRSAVEQYMILLYGEHVPVDRDRFSLADTFDRANAQ